MKYLLNSAAILEESVMLANSIRIELIIDDWEPRDMSLFICFQCQWWVKLQLYLCTFGFAQVWFNLIPGCRINFPVFIGWVMLISLIQSISVCYCLMMVGIITWSYWIELHVHWNHQLNWCQKLADNFNHIETTTTPRTCNCTIYKRTSSTVASLKGEMVGTKWQNSHNAAL